MTQTPLATTHIITVRWLFGLALGLGAALLFWQQLMLGRELLPVFGSVPTVWLVSLVVYQTILLLGYAAAHAMRHWPSWAVAGAVIVCISAAGMQHALLPNFSALGLPEKVDTKTVILTLCGLSGMSLFVFSMVSPFLQHLYARLPQPDAHDPYFLYAASNIGSFAGLLLFPLLLEPLFGVSLSRQIWFVCAALFVVLMLTAMLLALRSKSYGDIQSVAAPTQDIVQKPAYGKWLFYAFVPCALSFGATTHLISDIAPLPLLSMVPLGLYLLTFVLAFSKKDRFDEMAGHIQLFLIAFYIFREIFTGFKPGQVFDIIVVLAAFFMTAWRCHRELVKLRPSARYLTAFYLTLALGGALGGMFNVFIVPFILPLPLEFALLLLVSLLPFLKQDLASLKLPQLRKMHAVIIGVFLVALFLLAIQDVNTLFTRSVVPVVLVIALMLMTMLPSLLAVGSMLMIGVTLLAVPAPIALQRDFFGVKRVLDRTLEDNVVYRTLLHGTTSHGMQQRSPEVTTTAHLYYAKGSGLHDMITQFRPQAMGIVGLGMGAIACMPDKSTTVRYFEIDPGVETIAKQHFTFLHDCPAEVVLGDARKTLVDDRRYYDMLVVDAFSSDAIPTHLLTEEMFKVYAERLDRNGFLVFHISNRFLTLRHVLAGAAKQLHWHGVYKAFTPESAAPNITSSEYAVLSKNKAALDTLLAQKDWQNLEEVKPVFWTDDHINILPILNLGFGK